MRERNKSKQSRKNSALEAQWCKCSGKESSSAVQSGVGAVTDAADCSSHQCQWRSLLALTGAGGGRETRKVKWGWLWSKACAIPGLLLFLRCQSQYVCVDGTNPVEDGKKKWRMGSGQWKEKGFNVRRRSSLDQVKGSERRAAHLLRWAESSVGSDWADLVVGVPTTARLPVALGQRMEGPGGFKTQNI